VQGGEQGGASVRLRSSREPAAPSPLHQGGAAVSVRISIMIGGALLQPCWRCPVREPQLRALGALPMGHAGQAVGILLLFCSARCCRRGWVGRVEGLVGSSRFEMLYRHMARPPGSISQMWQLTKSTFARRPCLLSFSRVLTERPLLSLFSLSPACGRGSW